MEKLTEKQAMILDTLKKAIAEKGDVYKRQP